ncbi:DUF4317 domain-containing protein [Lachnospiraceae bacterium MD1]|uniref:DUF4317 domain-containing protein n=1 Tax=Variimorphobacter saccharofermentans TaxID=2755051 RepID=A0A839JXQ4_9FIRM|nr:DUF4317 domain-containing protein [Variimorphobacter saccharofermentans]MBB2182455.1 DUF4317 domain-containing protein [Variimorphobacter saccharofermentans]
MINSEIIEIRKQFKHENCAITKVSGCYVDGEKVIKTKFTESFLCLPEEETFKYFEIFKKTLSGTIGKNLINMDFPTETEFNGGTQEFLLKLRDSELKDETLLDEFYDKVIQMYDYTGNYLILLLYAAYDVPGKTGDRIMMDDASEEVYRYILCSICPVNLSKPGLSYHEDTNQIQKRIQDWVVGMPNNGFLFPAFNDRSTDIHSILYYSKDSEELHDDFINQLLGCEVPLSAGGQKETFQTLIKETLGDECEYEIVKNIHEKLNEIIVEHKEKEIPEPLVLDKTEVKSIFAESGVEEDKLEEFDKNFDKVTGENVSLLAANVTNTRVFEVKTPDVIIKVNPDRTELVETKIVDGRRCLVIEITDQVEVNGISVKTSCNSRVD